VETGRERTGDDDPVALRGHPGALADVGLDGGEGIERRKWSTEFAQSGFERVDVAVEEAGEDGGAVEVDDAGRGSAAREDLGVGPDRGDTRSFDGDGLTHGKGRIDGDDPGVVKDEGRIGPPCDSSKENKGKARHKRQCIAAEGMEAAHEVTIEACGSEN
jgi:hypothetical protein